MAERKIALSLDYGPSLRPWDAKSTVNTRSVRVLFVLWDLTGCTDPDSPGYLEHQIDNQWGMIHGIPISDEVGRTKASEIF